MRKRRRERDAAWRLPTETEINVFDSLDERCAVEHFLGKTREQAQALFREDFFRHNEYLMFMGPVAFRYYVRAAVDYLLGAGEDLGPAEAWSFCSLIAFRLDTGADEVAPVASVVREGLLGVLERVDVDGDDARPYGDLAARCRALLARLGG